MIILHISHDSWLKFDVVEVVKNTQAFSQGHQQNMSEIAALAEKAINYLHYTRV